MEKIRILSWNVNGLRAVLKKDFLRWIDRESPDILCVQETKAHPEQLPVEVLRIPGYQAWFSRPERKGYSGVGIWSRIEPIKVTEGMGEERFDREGRVLQADFGDFILLNVYFPNGKASLERLEYKMEFYESFRQKIRELRNWGKKVIVCGDMNTAHREIDLARPKENEKNSGFLPRERAWIDRFLKEGFVDAFRAFHCEGGSYTWWDLKSRARERNVGWRIDYFFVSGDLRENLKNAFHLPEVLGSDHCPVGIELERG